MSGPKKLGWRAVGGDAAGALGGARWRGLRSPQWGQWVRQSAAPRQTQWSGLQGRAAFFFVSFALCIPASPGLLGEIGAGLSVVAAGVRRGGMLWLAVGGTCGRTVAWASGGWRRAHAGGRVGGACDARVCSAGRRGGGPVLGDMSCGRFSGLVEQEFREVGLVRLGQGGCMLQVFGGVCR